MHFNAGGAWQPFVTLIGSLTALSIAVWTQHRQDVRDARDHDVDTAKDEEQRRRKSTAARSAMPASLSDVCYFAQRCAKLVSEVYPKAPEADAVLFGKFSPPELPRDAIRLLRDSIEFADLEDITPIAECISKTQVLHSRLSGSLQDSEARLVRSHELDSHLVLAIQLYAYTLNLFAYARLETDHIDTNANRIYVSAIECGVTENNFPDVFKLLRLRKLLPEEDRKRSSQL